MDMVGLELVDTIPSGEPYFFIGEEVWCTETLLDSLLKQIPSEGCGRLRCTDDA